MTKDNEKKKIQEAARNLTARLDFCGYCGKKIISLPEKDSWYHYDYQPKWISLGELTRYCRTAIERRYMSDSERKAKMKAFPRKAKASPKVTVKAYYKSLAIEASTRLKKLARSLEEPRFSLRAGGRAEDGPQSTPARRERT